MKQIIHSILKKYGLRIINRKKIFKYRADYLSKYPVQNSKELFLDAYEYVIILEKYFPDIYFQDSENGILITLQNLKFQIETKEEFFIICEIYIDKDYNFLTPVKCSVIDIGCNIGLASLFFSRNPLVDKIYSFEPVQTTYKLAQYNFLINSDFSSKIASFNFGLGKSNRNALFLFDSNIKGNTGIRGKKSASYILSESKNEVEVQLKDVFEVFQSIFESTDETNFVVKMDCEGAEYEIMERLEETKMFSKISTFMIEWHDEGSKILEEILIKNNYIIFSRNLAINSGMLYAYRIK